MMHLRHRPLLFRVLLFAGLLPAVAGGRPCDLRSDAFPDTCRCLFPAPGANGIPVQPTLVWSERAGAASYVVACAADSGFAQLYSVDSVAGDCIARVASVLPYARMVYWRVGVLEDGGGVTWGPFSWFSTARAPQGSKVECAVVRRHEVREAWVWLRLPVRTAVTIQGIAGAKSWIAVETSFPWITSGADSIPLLVQIQVQQYGEVQETLAVITDAGLLRVAVHANSPPPRLSPSAMAVWCGAIALGDTGTATVRLTNSTRINDALVKRVRTRTQFFSVVQRSLRPVGPGAAMSFAVRFHPKSGQAELYGRFADTLVAEYDGGIARVVLEGESPPPRPLVDKAALDFGDVAAQDTGMAVVRIANGSINALRLDSMHTRQRVFVPLQVRASIERRDTLVLRVRFIPSWHGAYRDTLVVMNNSWRGPLRIPLTAYVPYPEPCAEPPGVDLGAVVVGDTAGIVLRIGNASPSSLRVDSIGTRRHRVALTLPQLPAVLLMGDSLRVGILFRADSVTVLCDTLVVATNGPERIMRIPIAGSGCLALAGGRAGGVGGEFELSQNFPNPFNASTTFRYVLPVPSRVRLEVFTTLGQSVALLVDGPQEAGYHTMAWRTELPSGMYYCRLSATPLEGGGKVFVGTRKVVIVR